MFEENISNFKKTLVDQRLPTYFDRKRTIRNRIHTKGLCTPEKNNNEEKEILLFVTQYPPSVSSIKEVLMNKRNLIQD